MVAGRFLRREVRVRARGRPGGRPGACLPRSWTGDRGRLAAAGVPEETGVRTRPQLLQLMIDRAFTAGIPFGWVTADGARGERRYDWALVASIRPEISLLIRRSVSRPSELAFYLCHTPRPVPLSRLVKVAGARWAVEECFQAAKNETGMDHYQVRRYETWYRYVTLVMLALAFLAVTRAALADDSTGPAQLSQRDPPHAHRALRAGPRRAARPPLVTMAPPPPGTCPTMPLPATTTARSLSAAGVLVRQQHFVIYCLSSPVVAGSGAVLVGAAPVRPGPCGCAAGDPGDQVCQETADLAERDRDEAAARAFGALAAVTAR